MWWTDFAKIQEVRIPLVRFLNGCLKLYMTMENHQFVNDWLTRGLYLQTCTSSSYFCQGLYKVPSNLKLKSNNMFMFNYSYAKKTTSIGHFPKLLQTPDAQLLHHFFKLRFELLAQHAIDDSFHQGLAEQFSETEVNGNWSFNTYIYIWLHMNWCKSRWFNMFPIASRTFSWAEGEQVAHSNGTKMIQHDLTYFDLIWTLNMCFFWYKWNTCQ